MHKSCVDINLLKRNVILLPKIAHHTRHASYVLHRMLHGGSDLQCVLPNDKQTFYGQENYKKLVYHKIKTKR